MTLLFPNFREIEEDMREEYLAAKETGLFQTVLFNYDEWLAGDGLRIRSDGMISNPVVYRGWMLKPKEYERLYSDLKSRGIQLLTTPEEYQNLHLFPNVYPDIKDDTAGMMIFEDRDVDVEAVKREFSRFMVKDSVKSVKGTEFPAFFDHAVTQQEFDEWMQVFYKYRGDLLTGGICIKEYLELKRYDGKTNEFRIFYVNHQIISVSWNSGQPDYTCTPPEHLISKYSGLKSPYYTIDYAELSDGAWRIIEAGNGSVSGLSPEQDAAAYFRALYQAVKDVTR